jgi:hypothetical protein
MRRCIWATDVDWLGWIGLIGGTARNPGDIDNRRRGPRINAGVGDEIGSQCGAGADQKALILADQLVNFCRFNQTWRGPGNAASVIAANVKFVPACIDNSHDICCGWFFW